MSDHLIDPRWSAQTIFNRAAKHLLSQGRKSFEDDFSDTFAYLGADGAMCAVGGVMYKGRLRGRLKISPKLNTQPVWALVKRGLVAEKHVVLLSELQAVHDSDTPIMWRDALRRVGRKHGLDTSVLDNA